ncbi:MULTISPECIES: hypothetical protein [unclassified Rhizobium]|uniref:hypothetical protein n=1 Tax=unclassified Rhizobium TaxID=2613769 RepID=UPI0007149B87|nr:MULTISPECIES: hypothetical protein [unclassified Rhizobium]KQS89725.1 hypothetical protein ASG42_13675 [Rhizobium sp. Leaf391]KQS95005.1 hypothetical protein ASG50_27625 [Rhizobium sp. Leaf386]KQU01381.1 hypothetical protein ASG68_06405 [Rhizobium sp. Leaf453]
MWVLMYVFSYSVNPAATDDRTEWRLRPNVVFQEFSSEERCMAAKSKLEASLKEAGTKLRSGLESLQALGAAGPEQIIIAYDVECLPK